MDAASVPIKLSAISKNIETGKKILAERNEVSDLICSDTHVQKTMNPEPKITSFSIMNHDDKINALVVEDSSLMPYDPLTNYLTPRPKFLRYKPNRRRDIFLTQKNGVGEREDALTVSRRGSFNSENCTEKEGDSVDGHGMQGFSSSQESELEQEDEEVWGSDVEDEEFEESDEEFEESDEEDGEFEDNDEENEELEKGSSWNVKRALKFLLLCFILVLSTAYISSMNSQAPSPISQCFEVARHGYWMIQNHTDDSTAWKHEGGIGTRQQTGVLEVNQKAAEEGTKVEEMVQAASESKIETGGDFLDQKEETQKGIIEWVREEIVVEDATGEIIEITDKLFEDLEQEGGGNEDVEMVDNQEKEPVDGMFEVLELRKGRN
ncbi:Protein Ycf2 like [Quillaja saponaria]|uniref:Protein Ycf2 like n=1 Tax=Quillaja saponaria TaxID=32244 RepID=A0AAD7PP72_QUISA|nr:Protein Ycf2 like [Quillaja saponaria]